MSLESISTIADVFSALGTVGAVIVALWLASRDGKVRVKVYSGFYEQFIRGASGGHKGSFFGLFATNIGRRPASIGGSVIKVGLFKPDTFLLLFAPNGQNPDLPLSLNDGDQASFLMPETQFLSEMKKVSEQSGKRWDRKYIRVGVFTRNGGDAFTFLKGRPLKEMLKIYEQNSTK